MSVAFAIGVATGRIDWLIEIGRRGRNRGKGVRVSSADRRVRFGQALSNAR